MMNSRKPKAGGQRGPVGQALNQQQSYSGSRYGKQQQQQSHNNMRNIMDNKNPVSPGVNNNALADSNKTAAVATHTPASAGADAIAASVEGVYLNGRIMHTITSLIGSIVQVVVRDGQICEGVLKTFSPDFEIAIAAATEIDPQSPTEGSNIGHLISSLSNKHEMTPLRLFPMKDVVTINVLNTDMDYASHGSFETDEELARRNRVEKTEERTLVPWSSDDGPDGELKSSTRMDLETESNGGWSAEEMFAADAAKRGSVTGFQELDLEGGYTIALKQENTPEARQKAKVAEAIAREIEGNTQSRRRAEQENSDERTEEEMFSAVPRNQENFASVRNHGKAHVNSSPGESRSKGSEDLNWRQQSNRTNQQSMHTKSAAFSGRGSFSPADQRQQLQGPGRDRQDQRSLGVAASGPKGRQQQQQSHVPPHHPHASPNQHQQQASVNQSSGAPHPPVNQQQQPPQQHQQQQQQQQQQQHQRQHHHHQQQQHAVVPAAPLTSPNEDIASKPIITSSAPPTPPNYAKVVAEDGFAARNAAKASKKKEEMVSQSQQQQVAGKSQPQPLSAQSSSQSSASSPVVEKKDPPQIVREKTSPTEATPRSADGCKKQEETSKRDDATAEKSSTAPPTATSSESEQSIENIAKNSKLNPNAKEFTLNPSAKPFTPRSQQQHQHHQQQQQPMQQLPQQQPPPHMHTPPTQYSNQPPQNIMAQVHHIHHQHFQQQNPGPQMMQIQAQGVPRMQNQQVLLHQMVGPGGSVFPYQPMPFYQQQVPMNQPPPPRPGKQSSKYQGPGRNDQYNQSSPHNVAAATGHPVLATAPISYQQQPGLAGHQIFQPMYQVQGFNPRMPIGMMGPQVQYDPTHMYLASLPVSVVAPPMNQPNNGPPPQQQQHSNPSTPQSQTPTTPGLHGGPPTPGPAGHPHQGQTPTPQQTVMYTGQNMTPQSMAGGFNSQSMVLMGPSGPHPQQHQQSHQSSHQTVGVTGQPGSHTMAPVIMPASATPLAMSQHYQQNQPPGR